MGNVEVKHREQRGIYEAGSEIQDPKDFFDDLINQQFDDVQQLFYAANEDQQASIKGIFAGEDVFSSQSAAQMWFDEVAEEPEELQQAKNAIMPFLTI